MTEKFTIKDVPIRKGNSTAYNINYYVVFCPKYRKQVLFGKIKNDLEVAFRGICGGNDWTIIELVIQPDRVHMFISAHPKDSPMAIVKKLKGISAKIVFKKYPEFQKREYWGRHLWSAGYYVGTAGVVTAEAIEKYIRDNSSRQ